jgi:hypothetical protein
MRFAVSDLVAASGVPAEAQPEPPDIFDDFRVDPVI